MAQRVTVPVIKPLTYEGRSYVRGDRVTMVPVDAAVAARRGQIALSKGADPRKPVAKALEAESPTPVRRPRTYRRKDLVPEQTKE